MSLCVSLSFHSHCLILLSVFFYHVGVVLRAKLGVLWRERNELKVHRDQREHQNDLEKREEKVRVSETVNIISVLLCHLVFLFVSISVFVSVCRFCVCFCVCLSLCVCVYVPVPLSVLSISVGLVSCRASVSLSYCCKKETLRRRPPRLNRIQLEGE